MLLIWLFIMSQAVAIPVEDARLVALHNACMLSAAHPRDILNEMSRREVERLGKDPNDEEKDRKVFKKLHNLFGPKGRLNPERLAPFEWSTGIPSLLITLLHSPPSLLLTRLLTPPPHSSSFPFTSPHSP